MKTIYIKYIASALFALALSGCNDYLDVVPKGAVVLKTVEDYEELFNSDAGFYYPNSYIQFLSDNEWAHPANINRSYETAATSASYINYAWDDSNPQTRGRVAASPFNGVMASGNDVLVNNIYQACYARINRICNVVLTIDNIQGNEAKKARLKSEARALRAYNHFFLVNVFAKHYDAATAATDNGIYLRIEPELSYKPVQATVAQVYQAIEDDINAAIPNLAEEPQNHLHFSKAAGYALKAKIHLFKKEFDKAKEAALASYNLNHAMVDMIAYYNSNPTDPTKRYRVDLSEKENLYFASIGNATASPSPLNQLISKELVDIYNENGNQDVRLLAFFGRSAQGATQLATDDGFGPLGYIISTPMMYAYNTAGLRTTDVMLILAECYAREGNYTEMSKYLNEVRSKRIIGYTNVNETPASKVDAVNLVIKERRKELPLGYNRWWDMRRLNSEPEFQRTYKRTIPANSASPNNTQKEYSLEPDSYLYVCPFPLAVLRQSPDLQNNTPEFVDR